MEYLEIKLKLTQEVADMVVAELVGLGYDSFQETEEGIYAYVDATIYSEEELRCILDKYGYEGNIEKGVLQNKNWNEEWEKNFDPVIINDQCIIRAPFHDIKENYLYDIVIFPKMSFGTGHHETTSMMLKHQMEIDHMGKNVLDAGSGTGILAIMASKLGAKRIFAYDIDDWAYENIKENINLNGCSNIEIAQGDLDSVDFPDQYYDIILANINKNVLLEDIPGLSSRLAPEGILVLSGFYENDLEDLEKVVYSSGLRSRLKVYINNNWISASYQK